MLTAIVICPDEEIGHRLETALEATGVVSVERTLNRYPNAVDLVRIMRAHTPEVVFLSFEAVEQAHELVKLLEAEADGIQIVAVHRTCDARLLRETMRAGVREFLSEPFERDTLMEALRSVHTVLQRKPPAHHATNQIFTFLPSKAGVGTSTIALNTSAALARRANTQVLLSDFDLTSGMIRFMLKLQNEFSLIEAAEHAHEMDETLWPQMITSIGALDVLHAGRLSPNLRIDTDQIRLLVDFMRRNYKAITFDLSGNLERYSIELMQLSKRVIMVCTPEIPSLHLARQKLLFLRDFDLHSRVGVVLNRSQKKAVFSHEQVEELLGIQVIKTFPNDYNGVNHAMRDGGCISPSSAMGKVFDQFAQELLDRETAEQRNKKRKFLERFVVTSQDLIKA